MFQISSAVRALAALAVLLSMTLLGIVGPRATHAASPNAPSSSTFTNVLAEEPPTMDPDKTSAAVTTTVMGYIGDPLINLSLNDKKYVRGLATKWKISHRGHYYDFQLRHDVKFQDGTPLTASAVVATYKRAISPAIKSPVAGGMLGPVKTIKTTGKYSFEIRLKQPFAFLLYDLTSPLLAPLSPTALAKEGDNFGRHPVSTGPWIFKSWITGSQITLQRNPNYHWAPPFLKNHGPAHIKTIVFRIITDEATQTAAFQSGEADELALPSTSVRQFTAQHKYKIYKYPRQGVGLFMEFNVTKAPFNDIRVRRALNYAINKKAVLAIGLQGLGITACGTLSPTINGYSKGMCKYRYSYNPKKALQLLAQAGWSMKGGTLEKNGQPLTFTIITPPIDSWKRSAAVVQQQLKAVGITMNIQTYDFATVLQKAAAGDSQADFMGYTYSTSHIFYIWFHSSQIGTGLANSHFRSAKLDSMIMANDHTANTKKRDAIDRNIQKFIANQALWVPLWTNNVYVAFQPRVHGQVLDKLGNQYLQDATLSH